jgi:hypothetical protein
MAGLLPAFGHFDLAGVIGAIPENARTVFSARICDGTSGSGDIKAEIGRWVGRSLF